jgi:hypothetical protein
MRRFGAGGMERLARRRQLQAPVRQATHADVSVTVMLSATRSLRPLRSGALVPAETRKRGARPMVALKRTPALARRAVREAVGPPAKEFSGALSNAAASVAAPRDTLPHAPNSRPPTTSTEAVTEVCTGSARAEQQMFRAVPSTASGC